MDPYSELKKWPQWIICRDKIPFNIHTGEAHNAHDPGTWMTWDQVQQAVTHWPGFKEAFVFTARDPFFFLDIDKCLVNGAWTPAALSLLAMVPGALVEVSTSGTGLHAIGRYAAPVEHSCKNNANGIEFYTQDRFAVIGHKETAYGDSGAVVDVAPLVQMYFPPSTALDIPWSTTPVPEWRGIEDDDELIARMLMSKGGGSVFGGKASIRDLWENNESVLAEFFRPNKTTDPYDRSGADSALAAHLAFWTGKNHQRMWDLMWRSKLVRTKWTSHKQYLQMTISNAVAKCNNVFGSNTVPAEQIKAMSTGSFDTTRVRETTTLVGLDEMVEFFSPFVYIASRHVMFDKRTGATYTPVQFKAIMGGIRFHVAPGGKPESNAFVAFTESELFEFPKVYDLEFMPNKPKGEIITRDCLTYINSCVLFPPPMRQGDVSMLLNHIQKMMPNGDDAQIFLTWAAAIARNPGRKAMWAPVLVGVEGNGKSILAKCLEFTVGPRYTARPNARDIANKFNAWMEYALLAIVDEINAHGDGDIMDTLKVLVTSDRMEIQAKGVDAKTGPNWANFMFMSNYVTGLPVTEETRRLCILVCAQTTREELLRDFPGQRYFPDLVHWLDNGGYEMFAHYLLVEHQIDPRYDPYGDCNTAPRTSTTGMAISKNRNSFQQYIQDAVDEERPGFAGGWISSNAIKRLMREMRMKEVSVQRFADMLKPMGYIKHPMLINGRVDNPVLEEGTAKPILFIKDDHPLAQVGSLVSRAAVSGAFIAAQNYRRKVDESTY